VRAQVGIQIGRCGNAAGEIAASRFEQRRFGRGKHGKAGTERRRGARVGHVAGGILQARDPGRIRFQQPFEQRDVPLNAGHGRIVIEVDRNAGHAHQRIDIRNQPVVRHALIIKGRKDERAAEAELLRGFR